MTDPVEVRDMPFAVSGLRTTYQATLIDGKQLAFETVIDATADREALDAHLDTFIGAAKRQQAIEELPLERVSLATNLATLRDQERGRAQLVATMEAKNAIANTGRRNPRPASDGDISSLATFDQNLQRVKAMIARAQTQIPYLEAVIRRDPVLPERFPQPDRRDELPQDEEAA